MTRAHQIKPGSVLLGRYTVECLVGVGGMGSVYKAYDADGTLVAIKVLERDEQHFSERFAREAEMLAELAHPAIVRCLGNGITDAGDHLLILEWLDGIDLAARLRVKPFSLSDVLQLMARMANALHFAHDRGMVHRDVKPGNIFLPSGRVADAKLLDFGMARWTSAKALTVTGTQMGTPAYMAPEQIRGERQIGLRADIFALGCVFYECLTGRAAFAGEHTMAVFYKILVEPTPSLTQRAVVAIPAIGRLVERMLAKHITDRPRSCREVIVELESILDRLPGDAGTALLERSHRRVDALTATEQHLVNVIVVAPTRSEPDIWRTAAQLVGNAQSTAVVGQGHRLTQESENLHGGATRPDVQHTMRQVLLDQTPTEYLAPPQVTPDSRRSQAFADTSEHVDEAEVTTAADDSAARMSSHDMMDMKRLGSRFEVFGARLDFLRDGSLIAVLDARTTATDQAINAARCALQLRQVIPDRPIALATGRAVVGQRQLIGEVIDRAVALLSTSWTETTVTTTDELLTGVVVIDITHAIRIDDLTYGLLGARFSVHRDDHGWLLVGAESDNDERRLLGQKTPFVGRRRELATLIATLDECVEDEMARAILVTGLPGYGKSRVAREFIRYLADCDIEVEVWRCGGDPMRAGLPLDMLAQVVRHAAGIEASDPVHLKREKLRARTGRALSDADAARVAAFLGELIKAPFADTDNVQLKAARTDPRLMSDQIRRAAEDLFAAEVRSHPVVLVLEDLHWGDRATLSVLDLTLRHLSEYPFLVLAFARPEVDKSFPNLWAGHDPIHLELGRLPSRAAKKLAQSVLGKDVDSARIDALIARADGNAFYLEELLRSAAAGQWQLPETVLAMVHSRLEGLDPTARRVLRAASIFGDHFWRGAVDSLLGGAVSVDVVLEELVERELLTRVPQSRFPDEVEYVFHHNLIREAAYGMLTNDDRTRGHRLAGKWLQRAGEGESKVIAEQLARGDAPTDALPFFLRAAEDALEAGAFGVALSLAERGVNCGAKAQTLGELRRVQVEAHYWCSQNAEASRRGAEALGLLSLGSRGWYDAAAATVVAWARLGDVDQLEAFSSTLARSRHPGHDRDGWVVVAAQLSKALFLHGRVEFATDLLGRIEADIHDLSLEDPAVAARVHRARADSGLVVHGDPATSMIETQRATRRFEEAGDLRQACMERIGVGYSMLELGLHEQAEAELRAALATAEHMGLDSAIDYAEHNLCLAVAYQGELTEARKLAEESAASYQAQENKRMASATLCYLAIILLLDEAPDVAHAEDVARRALALEPEPTPTRSLVLATLSRVLLIADQLDEAMRTSQEAIEIMRALGAIDEGEAMVLLAHAEALHAHGQTDEARLAIAYARERLQERAGGILREDWRACFLQNIPEHARTLQLADDWGV